MDVEEAEGAADDVRALFDDGGDFPFFLQHQSSPPPPRRGRAGVGQLNNGLDEVLVCHAQVTQGVRVVYEGEVPLEVHKLWIRRGAKGRIGSGSGRPTNVRHSGGDNNMRPCGAMGIW